MIQVQVELLQLTPNAAEFIGRCASICYDSSTDSEACVKRAASCVNKGHLATLRFAHATFKVSQISRACSHQFVRSKHLDFLQRSQRYCSEQDVEFITPKHLSGNALMELDMSYQHAHNAYKYLIAQGVKKEDARFVLPQATTTELIVTGNLQAWLDFIQLRNIPAAQWEIREVAKTINNTLAENIPEIFIKTLE